MWLYLNFHFSWVLGPFVHGRLQNLKTSEDIFGLVLTPLIAMVDFERLVQPHIHSDQVDGNSSSVALPLERLLEIIPVS